MGNLSKNQQMEQLLHAINHDLRTPLSNIRSAIAILLQDIGDPLTEEQRNFIEIIDHSTLRLLDQSNRLVVLNDIAFGQAEFASTLLSDLLARAKKMLKNSYEIEETTFITDSDPFLICHSHTLSATVAMLAAGDTKHRQPSVSNESPTIQTKAAMDSVQFVIHSLMRTDEFSHSFIGLTGEIIRLHSSKLEIVDKDGRKQFSFSIPLTA